MWIGRLSLRKVILLVAVLAAIILLIYTIPLLYESYKKREESRTAWQSIVDAVENCSFYGPLQIVGHQNFFDDDYFYENTSPKLRAFYRALHKTLKTEDLSSIRVSPDEMGRFDSQQGINLGERCSQLINQGRRDKWLMIGKYYLLSKDERALSWLEEAGAAGIADAYTLLGHSYQLALINPVRDEKTAHEFYLKAAEMKSIRAMQIVGEKLLSTLPEIGLTQLKMAAFRGSIHAIIRLADHYASTASSSESDRYLWALIAMAAITHGTPTDPILDIRASNAIWKAGLIVPGRKFFEFDGLHREEAQFAWNELRIGRFIKTAETKLSSAERQRIQSEAAAYYDDMGEMSNQWLLDMGVEYVGRKD